MIHLDTRRTNQAQNTREVFETSGVEKSQKSERLFERKAGPTLRSRLSKLVHTAVRRAKTAATATTVAALLVGATLSTGCATLDTTRAAHMPQVTAVDVAQLSPQQQAERAAVMELRRLIQDKKLDGYFARDSKTGAYLEPKAMDLFKRLPVIGPDTKPEELLALGLVDALPPGLAETDSMPQYVAGKQVFVRTSTNSDRSGSSWNRYEAGGTERITHHGHLAGMAGDKFVVEVDKKGGGTQRVEVSRDQLLELNQPSSPRALQTSVNGVEIDYSNPIVRAKIAQGFALIGGDLAKLDFTKPADDRGNRTARLAIVNKLFWNQKSEYVNDSHKDWQRVTTMDNLLNGGVGVCTDQGTTQWAYFQPFEKIAGFRILNVSGSTIDLDRGHNFNILWLAGSEEMFVTDRTWNSGNEHPTVDSAMDRAGYNQNRYVVSPNERAPNDLIVPAKLIKLN